MKLYQYETYSVIQEDDVKQDEGYRKSYDISDEDAEAVSRGATVGFIKGAVSVDKTSAIDAKHLKARTPEKEAKAELVEDLIKDEALKRTIYGNI